MNSKYVSLEIGIAVLHCDSELAKLEAIQITKRIRFFLDCHVALLLAMTKIVLKLTPMPRRGFATPCNDGLPLSWNNIKDEN